MSNNLKIILVIIVTFTVTFITSLLLEIDLFKTPERRILIDLFIILQIYMGFIIYKYLLTSQK